MSDRDELRAALSEIDGRGYGAYREIKGSWDLDGFTLEVEYVQGDPYARPTRLRAHLPPETTGFPERLLAGEARRTAIASFLARAFADVARERATSRGSGRSGTIEMEAPGQEVLPQTAVMVAEDGGVEARFRAGLPARGRRVLAGEATALLLEDVPACVGGTLVAGAHDADDLRAHAATNEDSRALRRALDDRGLVAFVGDGARLPRRTGVDDRPLEGRPVVPFESPEALRVSVDLPHAGAVTGMGIPRGVTLIVGGGYHGKSTLLDAVARGVYDHRPGDGRERVVTVPDAVKIRAEDGRSIAGVDISPFISDLPLGEGTGAFTTADASGSTSQAAAIAEGLEVGAGALLVDEDTAATNFMIRDRRMQALIPKEEEPITPFIDRVRQLHDERGVSSILVLGGSGDYLDVADTVIALREYRPREVTDDALRVAREWPTGREREAAGGIDPRTDRIPEPGSVDPSRGKRDVRIRVRDLRRVEFGEESLDLTALAQLVARGQTRSVSRALYLARERFMGSGRTVRQVVDDVMSAIDEEGLDCLEPWPSGDLAGFRRHELAAALNRLRSLRVRRDARAREVTP